jgi:hypothetical protein
VCSAAEVGAPCPLADLEESFLLNPSFEQASCPTALSQGTNAVGWLNAGQTPDLLSATPCPEQSLTVQAKSSSIGMLPLIQWHFGRGAFGTATDH